MIDAQPGVPSPRVLERNNDAMEALIFNFEIDKFKLKREREQWLKDNLVSFL